MTAPTAQPVMMFESVERPASLDAPSAGLIPSLGARPGPDREPGGAWLPDMLGDFQVIDPCDPNPEPFPTDAPRPRLRAVAPVTIRTRHWWQGRPMDFDDATATRYLTAVTSAAAAYELWTGEATRGRPYTLPRWLGGGDATNDYLSNPETCQVAAGPALDPIDAIAVLDGLGQQALRGAKTPVIHVTPAVAQAAAHHLTARGSTLRTVNGALVVADAGSPGDGPGGSAGHWGYVTGPVGVWLSPVGGVDGIEDTVDTRLNRRTVWAHRSIQVGFDPDCHIAVPIDYSLPALTGPSGG